MFTIRRMTQADKPAMLDISSRIWEGTDYLPGVFDAWVRDIEGEFAAVCIDDRLVGCGKLTFLTPRDAWFEGMRKDPRITEKGMADFLGRYFLRRLAGRAELQSVRFSTYFSNRTSMAVNERLGFRLRTSFSLKAWEGTREEVERRAAEAEGERPVVVSDAAAVSTFLHRDGAQGYEGLFVEGWRALPLTDEILAGRYCHPGTCRALRSGGRIKALSTVTFVDLGRRIMARVVRLDAADDAARALLLADVFAQAAAFMRQSPGTPLELEWMIPRDPALHAFAAAQGLKSWEREDDFLVYELPLDALR
jgi:hypothetical protein